MIVLLDKNNYVYSHAIVGTVEGGIEVEEPKDLEHFESNYRAYFLNKSGKLEYDEKAGVSFQNEKNKDILRKERQRECFIYINRGPLWYDTLTEDQTKELKKWYADWLNVTDTKEIPQKPEWLK